MLNRWLKHGLLEPSEKSEPVASSTRHSSRGFSPTAISTACRPGPEQAKRKLWTVASSTRRTLAKVRDLRDIVRRRGQSMGQLALAWTERDPRVTSTLVGASGLVQLEQNVATVEGLGFTDQELGEIEADSEQVSDQPAADGVS